MSSERITIRDVAEATGYSTATVSLALRDNPKLPLATRERIHQAAKKLGYQANPVVASMAAARWRHHAAGTSSTLAVISDQKVEGLIGLCARANRLGYKVEPFHLADFPDAERLSEVLYSRGILGVLVGQIFTSRFCKSFAWEHFSAVAISEGAFRPPVNLVMPDHFRAVQTAWDYAASQGGRRIGLVVIEVPMALDVRERRAAFMECQSSVPNSRRLPVLSLPRDSMNDKSGSESDMRELVAEWARVHKPDAILASNDFLWWMGLEIAPDFFKDRLFISLWKQKDGMSWPGLSLPHDEIGSRAVEWLDSMLRSGERDLPSFPATMALTMHWEDGW